MELKERNFLPKKFHLKRMNMLVLHLVGKRMHSRLENMKDTPA
jgi:hypothetical protein